MRLNLSLCLIFVVFNCYKYYLLIKKSISIVTQTITLHIMTYMNFL